MSRPDPSIEIDQDGSIRLNGERIQIPNFSLNRQVGRGANAVVFLGENVFINRQVAVKIWLPSARLQDHRDKFKQGIYEARKVSSLEDKHIIGVYDAGAVASIFYLIMEYFPSITLKEWLTLLHRPFKLRYRFATDIFNVISRANLKGIFHGDLHTRNILIHDSDKGLYTRARDTTMSMVDFRIIDFGTSYFSKSGFSIARHWRILEETLDHLLHPLKMRFLWHHARPSDITDYIRMNEWFNDYIRYLDVLLETGFGNPRPYWDLSHGKAQLDKEGVAFLQALNENDILELKEITEHFSDGP